MDPLHNTKQILLVDDEAIIAANLAAILGRYGYEMRIAVSGEEGVRIAEGDAGIDLVLMDLSLGKGIDGVEAARRILEKRLLPIVFLSNYMDPSIVQKTAAVDSYGYVVKDSAESVLVTTIGMALRLHEAHRAIRNKNDEIAAANEELQSAIEELEETNDELLERERELMAEREFNRTLVQSSPAFIVAINAAGKTIMMNESMLQALGYSPDEVTGVDYVATFVPPEDRSALAAVFEELVTQRRNTLNENRVIAKDGRAVLVEWHGRPVFKGDRFDYFIGIGVDITERRAAELERKASEERYRELYQGMMDGFVLVGMDGSIRECNMAFQSMLGYDCEELRRLTYIDITPERWHDAERRLLAEQLMTRGFTDVYEKEYVRRDGTMVPIELRTALVRDPEGAPVAMWAIVRDVSERKQAERERERAWALLEQAITQSPSGILIANAPDVAITMANPAALNIRGGSQSHLTGIAYHHHSLNWQIFKPDGSTYPPEDLPLSRAVLRGESTHGEEVIIRHEEGDDRWVLVNAAPVRDKAGVIIAGVVLFHDITDHKRTNEALRESEERLQGIANSLPGVIYQFYVRPSGAMGVYYISRRVEEIFGIRVDHESTFSQFLQCIAPEDRERFFASIALASAQIAAWEFEGRFVRPDGRELFFRGVSQPTRIGDEVVFAGVLLDVTEKKRTEIELKINHANLQRSQEIGRIGDWRLELGTMRFTASAVALRMFGFPAGSEPSFEEMAALITPDDRLRAREAMQTALAFGMPYEIEIRVNRRDDGREIIMVSKAEIERDDGGRPQALFGVNRDITDVRRVEEMLRESESRLRSFVETTTEGIVIVDEEGRLIEWNRAAESISGIAASEALGRFWWDVAIRTVPGPRRTEERKAELERLIRAALASGEPVFAGRTVFEIESADGSRRFIEQQALPAKTGMGFRFFSIMDDVTERVLADRALRESEERFRALAENSRDTIMRFDRGHRHLYVNPAAEADTGIAPDNFIGKTHRELGFPITLCDLWGEAIDAVFETGEANRIEFTMPNGMYVDWLLVPELDRSGDVHAVMTAARDITERKRIEVALQNSEEKFRVLFERAPMGIFQTTPPGEIRLINPSFASMFGYSSPEEMITESGGLTIKRYFDPGDRERLKEILANEKTVRDYRIPMVRRDGRPIWISMYAAQIINNVGETLYDGFAIDITERVLAESALRESEEQFRSIFENIRDAVGVGRGQSLLMGNRALREMFGYSAEEIAGIPVKNFLAPGVRARTLSEWDIADARDGAFPRKITRGLRRDGGEFDMEASVATYRYYGNTYFMVVLRDITARLRAEEEIRRLNRHILTVQEEERQKVSRDLHDSVGQTILAAKLNVEMFQSDPSRYGDRLSMGVQFIDKASQELREIYMNLYPSILSDLGLSATIKWYANHMLEANGIRTQIRIGIRKAIAHEIEVGLYRIVQEIFSNILRHSGANAVRIELTRRKGSLALSVEDNGLGLGAGLGSTGTGHGIANMRHRAQALGGAFTIIAPPEGGTRITVTIREDSNGIP